LLEELVRERHAVLNEYPSLGLGEVDEAVQAELRYRESGGHVQEY
jgi:hypothetical protein